MNIFEELQERGLIAQVTDEKEIKQLINGGGARFYIGFDPTADSLHVGHFMALCLMKRLQMAGNKPVVLLGGGTGYIGDPTGRTDLRSMLTPEAIRHNCDCFKKQMERFIEFGEGKAIIANNADWLLDLNYIGLLREVGACFTVNNMLRAECYKQRMEKGLSFLEFNYMIMQAYDFYHLNEKYGCNMQFGGDDQWSNMLAGTELIRKKTGKDVYDFYQYWRNVDDADVMKCIKMLTFISVEDIRKMEAWQADRINEKKEILAFELTKLVHGEEKALKAQAQAKAAFGGGGDLPEKAVKAEPATIIPVLVAAGICASNGEARRLIQQGGVFVNDSKVTDINTPVKSGDIIHKGKKIHIKITLL